MKKFISRLLSLVVLVTACSSAKSMLVGNEFESQLPGMQRFLCFQTDSTCLYSEFCGPDLVMEREYSYERNGDSLFFLDKKREGLQRLVSYEVGIVKEEYYAKYEGWNIDGDTLLIRDNYIVYDKYVPRYDKILFVDQYPEAACWRQRALFIIGKYPKKTFGCCVPSLISKQARESKKLARFYKERNMIFYYSRDLGSKRNIGGEWNKVNHYHDGASFINEFHLGVIPVNLIPQ